ncbi:HAD family hydrolase [Dechloromonas denitrificans]|jgi:HAD superfamily hydrolase (TIGR01490 family)|uniref:histidinol-phosphatase n=1 Tax=Dechloromonas denitrificans TaxID=281362 RepID=UPI001CF94DCD|nr:HAD family hydrolase [Dechloromonas denitrificans]UCV09215.1 HAD family hydrolase [Dechloromonas denitrificans]
MNLALFDLDNTLLIGDSDFEWAQFLISKGVVDRELQEARNIEFYEHYKAGTLDIYEFLIFQLAPLTRHSRAELDAWHREYMDRHIRPIISQPARQLVDEHLANGDLCAIVTATNSFVTGPIARELGVPHLIATTAAVDAANGAFSGGPRGTPSFRDGKIVRVESWLESLGLWWGSFDDSFFYSDSHNDLPLMGKVKTPVAVDPDDKLRQHSSELGWKIITLR